jgi:hypothetical protein
MVLPLMKELKGFGSGRDLTKISVKVADVPTKIRTQHLRNSSHERCHYANPLRQIYSNL